MPSIAATLARIAIPITALLTAACGAGNSPLREEANRTTANDSSNQAGIASNPGEAAATDGYRGPSVGAAKGFAALAYDAITASGSSPVTGNLGVSGAPVSRITGFDAGSAIKYGIDSGSPYTMRTILTQREVDALVDDIDVRRCDAAYPSLSDGVTLHPGVTCLSDSDASLSGRVTLDAQGDPNAFFVIRSESKLHVGDEAALVLANGAQACGVFWQVSEQVTIGKQVDFSGTVIAGEGIVIGSGSTLVGRALARTAEVRLDDATITLPVHDESGRPGTCSHVQ